MPAPSAADWLGLTPAEVATLATLDTGENGSWCKHEIDAMPDAATPRSALDGLLIRLQAVFPGPADSRAWLQEPNAFLNGLRPIDALQTGALDQVFNALAFAGAPLRG